MPERAAQVVPPLRVERSQTLVAVDRRVDEVAVRVEHRPPGREAEVLERAAFPAGEAGRGPRENREAVPAPAAIFLDEGRHGRPVQRRLDGRAAASPERPELHVREAATEAREPQDHRTRGADRDPVPTDHEMARSRSPAAVRPTGRLLVRHIREAGDEAIPLLRQEGVHLDR